MRRAALIIVALAALAVVAAVVARPTEAATQEEPFSCWPMHYNGTGPCMAFQNPARTLQFVRAKLLANGFYSASIRMKLVSPKLIRYGGIQDGEKMWGRVFKIGDRRIWITLETYGWGRSSIFKTSFVA